MREKSRTSPIKEPYNTPKESYSRIVRAQVRAYVGANTKHKHTMGLANEKPGAEVAESARARTGVAESARKGQRLVFSVSG